MYIKWLVFCVFVCVVFELDALNFGDEGVCIVKLSSIRRKRVLTNVSRQCGRRRCNVRVPKIINQKVFTDHTICCQGWQHDSEFDRCSPICIGCFNGRCIGPNSCACDAPLYLDKQSNNCIAPHCNPPCFNANCIGHNSCECYPNTRRYNESHCSNCPNGYLLQPDFTCTPICQNDCINGICSGINECTCKEGYKAKDQYHCEPICDKCENGYCIGPNQCECLSGYKKVNGACVPECKNCLYGKCIEPDVCKCSEGYKKDGENCTPVCENGCINGLCVAPFMCKCNDGFEKNEDGKCLKTCRPECGGVCDDDGNCEPQICVNGTIKYGPRKSRRNEVKLICCSGWKYEDDGCKPECRYGCVNGTCIKPDVCECKPPLMLSDHACIPPVCDPLCVNADCVGTNTCQCHEGFRADNATHCIPDCKEGFVNDPIECKPVCETPCINSVCTNPDVCTCFHGYNNFNESYCAPQCVTPCSNAVCTAPDTCTCKYGYRRVSDYHCEPVCKFCQNGECIAPDVCACHEGYNMESGICTPVCDSPCLNGICTEPNKCTCFDGYQSDPNNIFNCLPICEPICANASCVSPNMCKCDPGYEAENNWSCKPICHECANGDCIAPNKCQCFEGFTMKENKCSPVCTNKCQNGFCSAPEVCSCFKGFAPNVSNNHVCDPICEPDCRNAICVAPGQCVCLTGYRSTVVPNFCSPECDSCHNGDCVAPNTCQCKPGYTQVDGKCVPKCDQSCVYGYCTAPNTCTCNEGYLKNLTMPHVCYEPCRGPCKNGYCRHGKCFCNSGYELYKETCVVALSVLVECEECKGNCTDYGCWCPDGRNCTVPLSTPEEVASSTRLAGFELTWILGGAIGLLLIVLVLVVIQRMWTKRKQYVDKAPNEGGKYNSVLYTVPNTLITKPGDTEAPDPEAYYEEVAKDREEPAVDDQLLSNRLEVEDAEL